MSNLYKSRQRNNQLSKYNAVLSNEDDSNEDDSNVENVVNPECFMQLLDQTKNDIQDTDSKIIIQILKDIRNSIYNLKESCLQILVDCHSFELITQLLYHPDINVKYSAACTIAALIINIQKSLQFFYSISNFAQHLFNFIITFDDIRGIYQGLYSFYYFFKKYYFTNPNIFPPQLSIISLNSIYDKIKNLEAKKPQIRQKQIYIYKYITLLYIQLCKTRIDQSQYNIVVSWILKIFSDCNYDFENTKNIEIVYPYLFKLLKKLIVYDNMSKSDFFKNGFLEYVIQELSIESPQSNIYAYDLLTSIFDKGLQIKEFLSLRESIGRNPESTFKSFMEDTFNSIDKYHQYLNCPEKIVKYSEVSAAATRMLTSAIRQDTDKLIINYITTSQNSNFGFLSIVENLCTSNIFSLSHASSDCLIEIISRTDTLFELNKVVYAYRQSNPNSYCSFVYAFLTIAKMDDENLISKSLLYLYDLTNYCSKNNLLAEITYDFYSVDGYDTLNQIKDQNENPYIIQICSDLIQLYTPKQDSYD